MATVERTQREIGGRQGSRLTGRLFAKQMALSEEMMLESSEAFQLDTRIGSLLWVDDVVSCVEGSEKQKKVFQRIDNFAKKHKLEWRKRKM